ncbi:hypothetical protein D3C84_1194290 [compost metagenome]
MRGHEFHHEGLVDSREELCDVRPNMEGGPFGNGIFGVCYRHGDPFVLDTPIARRGSQSFFHEFNAGLQGVE